MNTLKTALRNAFSESIDFLHRAISGIGFVLIPLLLANAILYLAGSFVAWNFDPMHWWLIKSTFGRLIFVIFEITVITKIDDFWDI